MQRVPRSSIVVVRLRMYTKCIVFTRSGTEKLDLKTHIKIRGRYICCSWCQDGATLLSHSIDRLAIVDVSSYANGAPHQETQQHVLAKSTLTIGFLHDGIYRKRLKNADWISRHDHIMRK